jgi:hypothetical protein
MLFNSINKKICVSHMFKGQMSLLYVGCMKFTTTRFVGNFCPIFYISGCNQVLKLLLNLCDLM